MSLKETAQCRVCGSASLTPVVDLGEQYLQGSFVFPGKEVPVTNKFPTELVLCDQDLNPEGCGLLQMTYSVSPDILYDAYWYRSGINQTMREHLQGIVASARKIIGRGQLRVLDIGCNDGTLLKSYPDDTVRFGVDPSDVAKTVPAPIKVISGLFPSDEAIEAFEGKKFDVVTSIAMFYDLESPVGFASAIRDVLAEDGIWIFEMSYLPLMLVQNSFDTICHEHLEYYSFDVLENIVDRAGLKIFKHELNDINGGSIRCYATHKSVTQHDTVSDSYALDTLRVKERELGLAKTEVYRDFQEKISVLKTQIQNLMKRIQEAGKTVHIYGASTKGNTLLQWCGIDSSIIPYAADRNPEKYGAKTLGTDIQVISEEESRQMNPDFYLVLPWHFKEEFLRREQEALEKGTRFIFPLPHLEVVGVNGVLDEQKWV